ncbi:MAG TPA: sensor domain-containing diguanylate cyclase, partial [Thermoanaerobaculia bacterium]|nr:sensor domain-containing diguanylate cyclase [Thermoanaerobaculia bacterium]
ANEFVPSDSGSILLDRPRDKDGDRSQHVLTFVAAFGPHALDLLGRTLAADQGIAGHVYLTGHTYYTSQVRKDPYFFPEVDQSTQYRTESLIAIPIRIEQAVCGVLELINSQDSASYGEKDRELLEIFADYISISIQNVLDGRRAEEMAKRDNLTGLFNDRYLHIALANEIEACRKASRDLSLLFIDLDFFKRVNDAHGHLAGSQVLREVGAILSELIPNPETLAARYGGDEFVLILPGVSLEEAVDLAELIRTTILGAVFCDKPGDIQPEPIHLTGQTCSVGVASLNRHLNAEGSLGDDKSTLLRLADAAMYVAKQTGRNRTAISGEPIRRRI